MGNPKDIFMLCQSVQEEQELAKLDRTKFKAQEKKDGERVIAVKKGQEVILFNRRGNIITYKFNEVVSGLKLIPNDFMIDGEIVSFDNNFNSLQRRALTKDKVKITQLEKEIPCRYCVFDILVIDNVVVMKEPLRERIVRLNTLLKDNKSEVIELLIYDEIDNALMCAIERNGEGIVIKDLNGIYESKRSNLWLKHKLFKETTITITGFTENPKGIRATANDGTAVMIAGHHSDEVKAEMSQKGYATINIQYLTKSVEGKYRFPSYRGLCEVKNVG